MLDFTADLKPAGFDPANPQVGIYYDVPNDVYHSATSAISNSMLSMIHETVSAYQWVQQAPVDTDKLKVFELGTALHAYVTERKRFNDEYKIMPTYNLRTNKGKQDKLAFEQANKDSFIITNDDLKLIQTLDASLRADPRIGMWLGFKGKPEVVVVVEDEATGLKLRIRTDWLIETDEVIICLDLKTTENITKFRRDFFELRYDVQEAFYRNALEKHFGLPVLFLFGVVSKSVNCGRYEVACERTDEADLIIANQIYRNDLNKLAQAIANDDWIEYTTVSRTQKQREYFYEQLS